MLNSHSNYSIRPSIKSQKNKIIEIPNIKSLNDSNHKEDENDTYDVDIKTYEISREREQSKNANIMIPNVQRLDSSKIPLFESISPQSNKGILYSKKQYLEPKR